MDDDDLDDPKAWGLNKLGYSVNEVLASGLGSRASLYHWIRTGDLRVVHYGRKTLVLAVDLARLLRKLRTEGLAGRPEKPYERARRLMKEQEAASNPLPQPPSRAERLRRPAGEREASRKAAEEEKRARLLREQGAPEKEARAAKNGKPPPARSPRRKLREEERV
jgi:hypothetical protein